MALINCEECSTEISDKAKACPKCGNPMDRPEAKINPCPQCDFELEKGAITCPNCQNKFVIKDGKTGKYRKAYSWEIIDSVSSFNAGTNNDDITRFFVGKKMEFLIAGGTLALIAILALFEVRSNGENSNLSYPTCQSYTSALASNKPNFKKVATSSRNSKVRGKITNIQKNSGFGKIAGDADLTIQGSSGAKCVLSFDFDQNFTEDMLYRMRKGQQIKAQCRSYFALLWGSSVGFQGCKIK